MGSTKCQRLLVYLNFLVVFSASNLEKSVAYSPFHGQYDEITSLSSFEPDRKLIEGGNVYLDDTERVDPLDNFNNYKGGYDITNKHYWTSTIFTGIYGYAVGVVWLVCGMVYGGFLLSTAACCKTEKRKVKKRSPCSKQCYLWPILLGTTVTFLAMAASGVVVGGNSRFHSRAKAVVSIIMETADEASQTIYNTTGAMRGIRGNLGGEEASGFLNSTSHSLDVEAADIQRQAKKNRRLIDRGLKLVYIITTMVISLNLISLVALSVSGLLRFHRAFYLLIILCWILTTMCWLAFGIYFFLDRFTSDTCTALEIFQKDPSNSSLSSILPCDELLSAKPVLYDVSVGIYDLVNQVNANISVLQASSSPNIVRVCNPFSAPPDYHYQPGNCPPNTILIGDIPQVLKIFTCSKGNAGSCNSTTDFKTVEAYTSSIQNLLNAFPGMESLVECQLVKDAFTEILFNHCKPLKRYVRMVWAAMVFLSTIMVVLVLTWTSIAHHDRKRHFSDGSIKPHSAAANMLESGTVKESINQSEFKLVP